MFFKDSLEKYAKRCRQSDSPKPFKGNIVASGANLRGIDLRGFNLDGARLSSCDLSGAQLQNCDLSKASINYCKFDRANLSNAKLPTLYNCTFEIANLTGTRFSDTHYCNFRLAQLYETKFLNNISHSSFDLANIERVQFGGLKMWNTNFTNANLTGVVFRDCTFINCILDADFNAVELEGPFLLDEATFSRLVMDND
jgi:hypothetical protein